MSPDGVSCPRTTNSGGRPLGPAARAIREVVLDDLVHRYERMTVRQAFYQLEVAGVVDKTDAGYRQVQGELLRMRRLKLLPWQFITDGTRWQRKPRSSDSSAAYLQEIAKATAGTCGPASRSGSRSGSRRTRSPTSSPTPPVPGT